ncbi:hypothetical protein FB451DRAFT_1184622 [Mycena latifolia]|nr:hypothetical protein FB451DRAFT_1184622 [Mycena latifolia]
MRAAPTGRLIKPAVRTLAQNSCVPQSALERPESMGPARRSAWTAGRTGAHAASAPPQVSRAQPAVPTAPTQRQQLLQLLTPPPPRPRPPRPLPSPPCQHEDTRASANLQYGPVLACALQQTSKREDHRAQRPLRAPLQRRAPVTQVRAAHLRAHAALGTGASAEHSFTNAEHFAHGDKIPGLKVSGIDIIAAQQAVKFARKWAVDDKTHRNCERAIRDGWWTLVGKKILHPTHPMALDAIGAHLDKIVFPGMSRKCHEDMVAKWTSNTFEHEGIVEAAVTGIAAFHRYCRIS